ncbi:MAG: caspase family protein [Bacteroidetes bacterium]|nr:caspase family protein [Bacteroidota bacterium]
MMVKRYFKTLIAFLIILSSFSLSAQNFIFSKYKTLEGYNGIVRHFSYSPKGNFVAITVGDNTIELYDNSFKKIWNYQGNSQNQAGEVAFSPDEKYLIFSNYQSKKDIAILRISDKKIVQLFNAQPYMVTRITLSSDGNYLAVGGADKEINIFKWNLEKFEPLQKITFDDPDFQYIYSIKFSPDNNYLAACGIADNIYIYKKEKDVFSVAQAIPYKYWVYCLAFHPKESSFVIGTTDSTLIFNNSNGKSAKPNFTRKYKYGNTGGQNWDFAFSKDGKNLIAAKQYSVKIWNWNGGNLMDQSDLEMHKEDVLSVCLSPDNFYLLSSSVDKTAIVYKSSDAPDVAVNNQTPNKGVILVEDKKDNTPINSNLEGKNYLLAIGINKYKYWPQLNNATGDAKDVKALLLSKYQFESNNVSELYDEEATYKSILDKLMQMKTKIGPNDNLLIYFSGHGFYNKDIDEGFWIPVEAQKNQETEFLPNSTLLKYLKAINAKHIFLVADACFSGALFSQGSRGYIDNVEKFKSRWGLTSGRLEVVSDGQTGKNSPFASYFIKFLTENTKTQFSVSELIQYVKIAVSNNSDQTPIGSPLKNVGDEGGEFIFYLKK